MAALRNTTIGVFAMAGHTNIAAACRQLGLRPAQALALIGIAWKLNDPGGGTFDVSLIELHSGVVDVLATAATMHLGGDGL